jgi:hypothetical protein
VAGAVRGDLDGADGRDLVVVFMRAGFFDALLAGLPLAPVPFPFAFAPDRRFVDERVVFDRAAFVFAMRAR